MMQSVTVYYRIHDGYWGAECPQVPELVAGDNSLPDLVQLAREAVREFTGNPDLAIIDVVEESAAL